MNPTTDRERLKALVTQVIICLLEEDVYGDPDVGPAIERGGAQRHSAGDQAAGGSILYRAVRQSNRIDPALFR